MLTIGAFARLGQVSPRMLRHYDDLGLLRPEHIDPSTGYRFYTLGQLQRLHRLLALKDLGLSLEQIGPLMSDEAPSLEHLRGMLQLRRAQIQELLTEEQARLRRLEARLHLLERSDAMLTQDVVVKSTQPMRVATITATAPGFGTQNLAPVLGPIYERVAEHLSSQGARPGVAVAWYEEPRDDGSVIAHAGFALNGQQVRAADDVRMVDLPVIEVASVIHRGGMENIDETYTGLMRWIESSGYRVLGASRELYHEWHDDDQSKNVTELQMPITRA